MAEDDGLAAGVSLQHELQLLPQSLDFGAALEVGEADAVHNAVLVTPSHSRYCGLQITHPQEKPGQTYFAPVTDPCYGRITIERTSNERIFPFREDRDLEQISAYGATAAPLREQPQPEEGSSS